MKHKKSETSWLLPFVIVCSIIGFLFVAHGIIQSHWEREAVDFAAIIAAFGMIFLWLHFKSGAIERSELKRDMSSMPLTTIGSAQPGSDAGAHKRAEPGQYSGSEKWN